MWSLDHIWGFLQGVVALPVFIAVILVLIQIKAWLDRTDSPVPMSADAIRAVERSIGLTTSELDAKDPDAITDGGAEGDAEGAEKPPRGIPYREHEFGEVIVRRGFDGKASAGIYGTDPSLQEGELHRKVESDALAAADHGSVGVGVGGAGAGNGTGTGTGATDGASIRSGMSGSSANTTSTGTTTATGPGPNGSSTSMMQRLSAWTKTVRDLQGGGANRDVFYAKLKGPVLYLYPDQQYKDATAALAVGKYRVEVAEKSGKTFAGREGEMFGKRKPVVLRLVRPDREKDKEAGEIAGREGEAEEGEEDEGGDGVKENGPVLTKGVADVPPIEGTAGDKVRKAVRETEKAPWVFIFKNPTKKEDFYTACQALSHDPPSYTRINHPAGYKTLRKSLDAAEDEFGMRLINALLGRIFLGVHKAQFLVDKIVEKIEKKIAKVDLPNWVQSVDIERIHVGSCPPAPMLKDATDAGEVSGQMGISYLPDPSDPDACVRFTVAVTLRPTNYYAPRFTFDVRLTHLVGDLLIRIKAPPSNRFWYGFTTMPDTKIVVVPQIQTTVVSMQMVSDWLESSIKKVISEAIVLPYMDDVPFFDASPYSVRGGVFDEAIKTDKVLPKAERQAAAHARHDARERSKLDDGADVESEPKPKLTTSALGDDAAAPRSAPVPAGSKGSPVLSLSEQMAFLRKHPAKSRTLHSHGPGEDDASTGSGSGAGLARSDTLDSVTAGPGGKKAASLFGQGKKWFAQSTASLSTREPSQEGVKETKEAMEGRQSASSSRIGLAGLVSPSTASVDVNGSGHTEGIVRGEKGEVGEDDKTPVRGRSPEKGLPAGDAGSSRSRSIESAATTATAVSSEKERERGREKEGDTASISSTGSGSGGGSARTASPSAQTVGANLIRAYRQGDKAAVQKHVTEAQLRVSQTQDKLSKRWGEFMGKRRGPSGGALVAESELRGSGARTGTNPSGAGAHAGPLYRPAEVEHDAAADHGQGGRRSMDGRSLQERLNAAAAAAGSHSGSSPGTSPVLIPGAAVGGRARSGTASSFGSMGSLKSSSASAARPALLSSPSKSAAGTSVNTGSVGSATALALGGTPPAASALAVGGEAPLGLGISTTTSATAASAQRRRSSGESAGAGAVGPAGRTPPLAHAHIPVSVQPGVGRGMVVPRVPKRAGEVTAIGSTARGEMVRNISGEAREPVDLVEVSGGGSKDANTPPEPPALPARKEQSALSTEREGGAAVPPPLPSREKEPRDLAAAIEADLGLPGTEVEAAAKQTRRTTETPGPPALPQRKRETEPLSDGDLAAAIETDVAGPALLLEPEPVQDPSGSGISLPGLKAGGEEVQGEPEVVVGPIETDLGFGLGLDGEGKGRDEIEERTVSGAEDALRRVQQREQRDVVETGTGDGEGRRE